jgi:hypothetical protein
MFRDAAGYVDRVIEERIRASCPISCRRSPTSASTSEDRQGARPENPAVGAGAGSRDAADLVDTAGRTAADAETPEKRGRLR